MLQAADPVHADVETGLGIHFGAVESGSRPDGRQPPLELGGVLLTAASVVALLILIAAEYGYHRDELYFIVAGQRPDWGYPDQPPLAPLLAASLDWLAPGSLVVLRLPSALAAGALIIIGALLAREMGGDRFAQLLSAVTVAVGTFALAVGHLLSTATFDLLAWAALSWVVGRILRTGDDRLWLVAGVIAGLALQNKHLIAFLAAALGLAILLQPEQRRLARSGWLWGGIGLAFAIWLPNLIWQAMHGWPALAIARDIASEEISIGGRLQFVLLQLVIFGVGGTLLVRAGIERLMREPAARPYRPFAVAAGLLFVFFAVSGGKVYYLAGLFPVLIAAGAVAISRRGRRRLLLPTVLALGAVAAPIALPILPVGVFAASPYAIVGEDQLNTIGWPEFIDAVAQATASVPARDRERAVIITGNYGEAGAVARFGPERGLPDAYSGHNAYGLWGPPPDGRQPIIVVGYSERLVRESFDSCQVAAIVDNRSGAETEEQGKPVWVCEAVSGSWSEVWPRLVHLSG